MERKVDKVKKTAPWIILLQRRENEHPSPYEGDEKNESPASKIKGIGVLLNEEDRLGERRIMLLLIVSFPGDSSIPSRDRIAIFFKNNTAS